jgi:pilus assembly protein CpaE
VGWTIARRLSSDVAVVDLDLPFGTASLDFNLEIGQGVTEAIQDASRLDEVLLDRLLAKHSDHLSILSAPTNLEKVYDLHESAIEPLLEVAQSSVPFIMLDMPHLWTAWAKRALIAADEIIVTASPDLANLRNAKNLINVLKQARPNDPPPKLVLNQVGMSKRPEIKPADFAKALQINPTACIPFEPSVFGTASNKGQMIAQVSAKGAAPKAFTDIANAITKRSETKGTHIGRLDLAALFGRMRGKSD